MANGREWHGEWINGRQGRQLPKPGAQPQDTYDSIPSTGHGVHRRPAETYQAGYGYPAPGPGAGLAGRPPPNIPAGARPPVGRPPAQAPMWAPQGVDGLYGDGNAMYAGSAAPETYGVAAGFVGGAPGSDYDVVKPPQGGASSAYDVVKPPQQGGASSAYDVVKPPK